MLNHTETWNVKTQEQDIWLKKNSFFGVRVNCLLFKILSKQAIS